MTRRGGGRTSSAGREGVHGTKWPSVGTRARAAACSREGGRGEGGAAESEGGKQVDYLRVMAACCCVCVCGGGREKRMRCPGMTKRGGHRHTNADASVEQAPHSLILLLSFAFNVQPLASLPRFVWRGLVALRICASTLSFPHPPFSLRQTLVLLLTAMRTVRVVVQEEEEEVPGWLVVVVEEEGKSFVLSPRREGRGLLLEQSCLLLLLTLPTHPHLSQHSHFFFYLHLIFTMARTSTLFVAAVVALMALVSAACCCLSVLPSPIVARHTASAQQAPRL